jgi:hypothetical protein
MFIEPTIEAVLPLLNKLTLTQRPKWGTMTAQGMVEHLTDMLQVASNITPISELLIPEEKLESMRRFLASEKEMMTNIKVPFAPENRILRNDELELAIDEFVDAWIQFEEYFEQNPTSTTNHPYYGQLNYTDWLQLHKKHLTHHFKQFDMI